MRNLFESETLKIALPKEEVLFGTILFGYGQYGSIA
jgi:hypothetical protein